MKSDCASICFVAFDSRILLHKRTIITKIIVLFLLIVVQVAIRPYRCLSYTVADWHTVGPFGMLLIQVMMNLGEVGTGNDPDPFLMSGIDDLAQFVDIYITNAHFGAILCSNYNKNPDRTTTRILCIGSLFCCVSIQKQDFTPNNKILTENAVPAGKDLFPR